MDEVWKVWLDPAYLPMVAAVALLLKFIIVPLVKSVLEDTHPGGYTPLWIAYVAAIVACFLFKALFMAAPWTAKTVLMTIIAAIAAATSAIGLNVTTQAIQKNDVSIIKKT